jgi:hypothetical protein
MRGYWSRGEAVNEGSRSMRACVMIDRRPCRFDNVKLRSSVMSSIREWEDQHRGVHLLDGLD